MNRIDKEHRVELAGMGISTSRAAAIWAVPAGPPQDEGVAQQELLIASQLVLFGEKSTEGQLIEAVMVPWPAIFREMQQDADFLLKFDPRKFEELVAAAYDEEGCEVTLTPRSGDRGRDVIAIYPGLGRLRILDQVKRYAPGHVVKADEVRSLYGVLVHDTAASKGVVTTTSTFAPGVREEFADVMPTRLDLRDGGEVHEWVSRLARRRGG